MKRAPFILLAFCLLLAGCGDAAGIAYTRGCLIESAARTELEREDPITEDTKRKFVNAIDQFSAAIKLRPRYLEAYHQRGLCNWYMGECEDAFEDLSEAIALSPHNETLWQERGMVSSAMCHYDKAIEDFDQCLRINPKSTAALTVRAEAWELCGNAQRALTDLAEAEKAGGKDAYLCYTRASAFRRLKRYDEMDAEFARALRIKPHDPEAYLRKGYAEFVAGQYKKAEKDLGAVVALGEWTHRSSPYAVILSAIADRFVGDKRAANIVLEDAIRHYGVAVSSADGAHDAQLSTTWPLPAIQYLHDDITADKLIAAAGADKGKLTEAHCYIGLIDEVENDKKGAMKEFLWVHDKGDQNFVEYEVACEHIDAAKSKQASPARLL